MYSTEHGFNLVLSEHIQGAIVHFFLIEYASYEPKTSYLCYRSNGFRIPSCDGKLQSLVYFQRHGINSILIYMKSFSGDLIDLYEYNNEQNEWRSTTILNSPQAFITSISLSTNQLIIEDNNYQGLFGRQILIGLSDGSIICFDKLNLKCKNDYFQLDNKEFVSRIQHTPSGT